MGPFRTAACCLLATAAGAKPARDPENVRPGQAQAQFLGRDVRLAGNGAGRGNLSDHQGFDDDSSVQLAVSHREVVECHAAPRVEHFGWKLSFSGMLVGCIFGMMGSGGSMVTKPLLYYLFHQHPFKLTIFEMYFVLLFLSAFGAVRGLLAKAIVWRHVLVLFLSTSIVGTSVGAFCARFISSKLQLMLFACLIIAVSGNMLRQSFSEKGRASAGGSGVLQCAVHSTPPSSPSPTTTASGPLRAVAAEAILVTTAVAAGVLCGFTGVGGGFLITPLLCNLGHDLKTAVPTSHAIILANACVGIAWYSHLFELDAGCVDTRLVAGMAGVGCLGMYCSDMLASYMPKALRQQVFAAMLFSMGVAITTVQLTAHDTTTAQPSVHA